MAIPTSNVPPFIAAQLNHLLNHFPLTLKVEQMWSGSKYYPGVFDRFTLVIPYCLEYIRWDVIYNVESPTAAPDVIFGPEDEDFHPFHMEFAEGQLGLKSSNKCLSDWNNKDPTRLLALIQYLRDQYVSYQRKRVGEVDDDRLKFEISTIFSREGIEMHMSSGAEKPEEVKFAVPLMDMNINDMVPGCPWRQTQKIFLQVIYPVGRKYMSAPSAPRLKLVSTPELKDLFSIEDVKLPAWLDGMCLAEYLPHLEESLVKQVKEAVSLIDIRRNFIEALACQFGRPLEADPVFCRKATVLSASGVFTFLVHFLIPTQFPKQQPSLLLQSSQHFNSQRAPIKSRPLNDYPWSPRWETSLMAERIFEFLAEEALNFKRQLNDGQLQ
ncbi:BRCA1-A complex subunit BRE [Senna tora]|uniref:BRISC and BRCA1-A complex member 2 n=1 Tax=Senna tora TaxID=362788 RepID=A0A834T925_9FABA|nr:BRCA1-A complex subunit BRE [Senna tora]